MNMANDLSREGVDLHPAVLREASSETVFAHGSARAPITKPERTRLDGER